MFPRFLVFFFRWNLFAMCLRVYFFFVFLSLFFGMGKYLVIPKLPGSLQPALFLVERGQETHQLVNRRRRE